MRADVPPLLRCPACHHDGTLSLTASGGDDREVREGTLECSRCGRSFSVARGVAELLYDPPDHVRLEAAGLARFAEVMAAQDWTAERILSLPDQQDGYWYVQRTMFDILLARLRFRPGQRVLDVGSNTCWAASQFAERGLQSFALDISTAELQGLYTADIYFAAGRRYFERILGTMNDIPLASNSMDYVFCCEVLHHNDSSGLRATLSEAHRILKPGGKLLVINETLKSLRDPSGVNVIDVEQFDGYEHAHWALQYRLGAHRAGFRTSRLLPPMYSRRIRPPISQPDRHDDPVGAMRWHARYNWFTRTPKLMWLNHVEGGVGFSMIATKH